MTNKDIGQAIKDGKLKINENTIDVANELQSVAATNAELMSLGAITNATNVTFDGARIVLDTDRIYTANKTTGELEQVNADWFKTGLDIITTDKDNVVLGYTKDNPRGVAFDNFGIKVVGNNGNVEDDKLSHGYMWVHNLNELRAMNDDPNGWYALRNSIDANDTASIDDDKGFDPIGDSSQAFTGRFDGLGYSIFGLNINNSTTDNVGLFGYAQNATIRNFTLNSSEIKGGANTGAAVGHADGGKIENVTNTGNVTGGDGTGGIVGKAENKVAMSGLINIGKVTGGVGTGGVVGSMSGGTLGGDTYNLGSVTGTSSVGGIVGSVTNATIGNEVTQDNPDAFQIFNQLNVTGNYNVGGIAGTMSGGKITNTANHGNVTAAGKTDDTYKYHTAVKAKENIPGSDNNDIFDGLEEINHVGDVEHNLATVNVDVANAGGIVGQSNGSDGTAALIENVINDGDVTSTRVKDGDKHYIAGNVGGIVGRAEDTNITNAENKENTVAGAHNVGGIAGFLGGTSTVDTGLNNGGDITATGARRGNNYVQERVRPIKMQDGQVVINEIFNVGNIGGIVGYLFGDDAKIKNSGNRGTVHSETIQPDTEPDSIPETAKAANVGGVVGKIDSPTIGTKEFLETLKNDPSSAMVSVTVSDSYSTGDVQGFTGVGGVVGMMYNGSITGAYNLGTVQSTRKATSNSREPLNMGGVIGDTTEETSARAVIYDVYNAGQIGDEDYEYYGRHVGGVVGRLSGELEKAYNTGDIYNGYSVTGGVVGWWYRGNIKDVFNTGNVTAVNNNIQTGSYVGGIVGALDGSEARSLSYAYNLGTIRSFKPSTNTSYGNFVSGIIGAVEQVTQKIDINNVYTSNNIYAAKQDSQGQYEIDNDENTAIKAIWNAGIWGANTLFVSDAYYVKLYDDFQDLTLNTSVKGIEKKDSDKDTSYAGFFFGDNNGWRIYNGTTPILNAFLPNAEQYFGELSNEELSGLGIADGGIQYGTAANPLLTIINANEKGNVKLDWDALESSGNASLAVYGGGLTLDEFDTGTGYYRGTLYADGTLKVDGTEGEPFNLGSSANLYGTDVEINANGDATIYGNVTSTNGGISINGDDIEILGKLTSSKNGGEAVSVKNIAKNINDEVINFDNLKNPKAAVSTVSDAYAHTPNVGNVKDGNITVNASGAAEVLYGNLSTGQVLSGGSFSVSGGESVYVDSDLHVGKDLTLNSDGEIVLDISNMGVISKENLHQNFLDHFKKDGDVKVTGGGADGFILALDMWDAQSGSFKFDKYNTEHTLTLDLESLSILINGTKAESAKDYTHVWVNNANQLKGIQEYAADNSEALTYNFALKDNIDATELENYEAIGGDDGFSGTFDGRDFRIIGLNADATSEQNASSGIFSTLSGTVKDLRVYASKFFGGANGNAGVIAASNEGTITGVTTFGNRVEAANAGGIAGTNAGTIESSAASDSVITNGGTAGGIAGTNTGTIGAMEGTFVTAESAVTSGANGNAAAIGGVVGKNGGEVNLANSLGVTNGANVDKNVGGIAGVNSGEMYSLYNESVVTGKNNVGGVAGTNSGKIENAVNTTGITATGDYAGGLAGVNSGTIDSGRNTGTINGEDYVGGMVGKNEKADGTGGILKNLSNAVTAAIFGSANVGGIAGTNSGTITSDNNLVNEGTVYGNQYVGGIAGVNEQGGVIQNVTSETLVLKTADGTNAQYFGGIAGQNKGIITDATNESNVEAKDVTYVGGIVGENTTIGKLIGEFVNNGSVLGRSSVGGLVGKNSNENLLVGNTDENGEITRLQVTNNGTVEATDGTAAGIVYEHDGNIMHADLINTGEVKGNTGGTAGGGAEHGSGGLFGIVKEGSIISDAALINRGTVTVTEGDTSSTGGVIGINHGKITNSTLINETAGGEGGVVEGGENTGGLIGKNTGDITYSSLINRVGAEVSGTENVGGLIGYNTGEIIGGRIDDSGKDLGLYTYKIYNNGEVTGATNVGGLIGNNADEKATNGKQGSLIAGYNTGVVTGSGENVGGIAGTNAGIIDQVFNTVMTLDKNGKVVDGAISGVTNVGGIVGSNTGNGTLTNAYNTTDVESSGTKGNIVGENSGTVENVYATNDSGTLFGKIASTVAEAIKNAYSFSDDDNDKTKQGITFIAGNGRNNKNSYRGFSISGKADEETTWRIYEGYNTPLLKVFLTDASYSGDSEFVYNASQQGINDPSKITAADERQAYNNVNSLLQNLTQKNAGSYSVWSSQIAGHTYEDAGDTVFDPNNLGYDIDFDYKIKKAQLEVTLDDIYRTYGNGTMYSDEEQNNKLTDYGSSFSYTAAEGTTLNNTMKDELTGKINITKLDDAAVDSLPTGKTTNDAGKHDWSATVSLAGDDDILNNYQLNADGAPTITVTGDGKSNVTPAELHITLNQVERTYGDTAITNNEGKYTFTIADGYGLVNGDDKIGLWFSEDYNGFADTALIDDKTKTDDAGTYHWSIPESENGYAGVFDGANIKNYSVTVTNDDGKVASIVNKRGLRIEDLLGTIEYGSEGDIELKENSWKFAEKDDANRTGIVYEDEVTLDTDNANREVIKGSEYALNRDKGSVPGRVTADVIPTEVDGKYGAYSESLKVSGLTLSGGKAGNYFIIGDNGKETDTVTGGIEVTPAELTIQLGDVERVYGDTSIIKGEYGLKNAGLKNGDNITFNGTNVIFGDDAIENGKTKDANVSGHDGTYMDEAIRYYWNVGQEDYEKVFTGINLANYIVDTVGGESKVAQRELTVSGLLASIVYGDKDGNGLKLKEGATLSGFADGYGDDSKVELVIGELTATGDYEDNRTKDNQNRATADVKTDGDGVYRDSLKAGVTLGGDSANNYYIADGTATGGIEVTPAPLTITLNNVTRTYGDADTFVNGIGYGIDDVDGLVNGDDEKQLTFAAETAKNKDKALSLTDGEWRTSDHGKYSYADGIDEAITGINLDNYEVKYKGGDSIVNKLTLKLSDLVTSIIYGDHGGQGFSDVDVTLDEGGVVYNDEVYLAGGLKITDGRFDPDGEYESDKNGRATANVGNYNQKVSFGDISLTGKDAGNYDVDGVMNAAITVTPAQLTIKADDQNMLIGTTPNFTGTTLTELANQLVNGDSLPDGFGYEFGLEDESILDVIGTHPGVIGLLLGGRFYDGGKYEDWGNTVNAVFANYNVNVEPGLLTIVPPSTDNYGHLHSDGWDRVRNFRERKAEVFFHKGGMEYDEDM